MNPVANVQVVIERTAVAWGLARVPGQRIEPHAEVSLACPAADAADDPIGEERSVELM